SCLLLRRDPHSFPTRRSSDLDRFDYPQTVIRYLPGGEAKAQQLASYLVAPPKIEVTNYIVSADVVLIVGADWQGTRSTPASTLRSEEHTSELQSLAYLVCRLL